MTNINRKQDQHQSPLQKMISTLYEYMTTVHYCFRELAIEITKHPQIKKCQMASDHSKATEINQRIQTSNYLNTK